MLGLISITIDSKDSGNTPSYTHFNPSRSQLSMFYMQGRMGLSQMRHTSHLDIRKLMLSSQQVDRYTLLRTSRSRMMFHQFKLHKLVRTTDIVTEGDQTHSTPHLTRIPGLERWHVRLDMLYSCSTQIQNM